MVGNDAIGGILQVVHLPRIGESTGHFLDRLEDRRKHVRVVIAVLALQDLGDALETHPRIDVLGRQRSQALVRVAVELDEDQVPDFDDLVSAGVDELRAGLVGRSVVMDLGAGAARAGVAHLPEVVFLVPQVNALGRNTDGFPVVGGFVVARHVVGRIALEDGHVQPRLVELPDIGQQFPGPGDCFLLEVIAERPVAEHLEKSVVIGVLADVVEIVVLAAGADAFLRVGSALKRARARAEEDVLELVHARIGKQQRRVVERHDR